MKNPKISVITPFSRGIKELSQLIRDFRNQTFRDFEHIIVADGVPSPDVTTFMKSHCPSNTKFLSIEKDTGNMSIAPGTRPRNFGVTQAQGEFVYFFDDDDRAKDVLLERLIMGTDENIINVVQMGCLASRISNRDRPDRIRLIPEVGLPDFPVICHVGTPCFIVKREWALENPWQDVENHDYVFIKTICDKYHPRVRLIAEMLVDVDGIIGDTKDWVSFPPMVRAEI